VQQNTYSGEAELYSANNSDSMVTLEGGNNVTSKMENILNKAPHGSTAIIEKNYMR